MSSNKINCKQCDNQFSKQEELITHEKTCNKTVDKNFVERMTCEIKSFGGKPLTEEEQKMKQDLISFFENKKD